MADHRALPVFPVHRPAPVPPVAREAPRGRLWGRWWLCVAVAVYVVQVAVILGWVVGL